MRYKKAYLSIIFIALLFGILFGVSTISKSNSCSQNNQTPLFLVDEEKTITTSESISPIIIDGNDELDSHSNVDGSGTWGDPYIIEDYEISGMHMVGINISNTDKPLIIRNCTIGVLGYGIYLYNASNVEINNITANDHMGTGISLQNSDNNTIIEGKILRNEVGVLLNQSDDNTIISSDSSNSNQYGIGLIYSNNNTIRDNNASDNTLYGIGIDYANNNSFIENDLFENLGGIATNNSNGNKFINNNATNNKESGIVLLNSNDNKINDNYVRNNTDHGILLQNAHNNTVFSNEALNNTQYGIFIYLSDNNTLTNNTVLNNENDGISLRNTFNVTLRYNMEIAGNDRGIEVINSKNATLDNNFIQDNREEGISLDNTNHTDVINNKVQNNGFDGSGYDGILIVDHSIDNEIIENIISDNYKYGIFLDDSGGGSPDNNVIYLNYFINNSNKHARDDGNNNIWDNGSIGNYWDNYTGTDTNNDGIGEDPYNITGSADSQDEKPIWWDGPFVEILTPNTDDLFNSSAPSFTVEILNPYMDKMWYSLNDGENITISSNGTIDQNAWGDLSDGTISIAFYANDTLGNNDSDNVTIIKDSTAPAIIINDPIMDQIFGSLSPSYEVEITDIHLDSMWYSINSVETFIFTSNGTINQTVWSTLSNGVVNVTFYANDTAGNIASISINVTKSVSSPLLPIVPSGEKEKIPGYSIPIMTALVSIIMVGIIISFQKRMNIT
jgi:parallel beta-helix repeat protein